MAKTKKSKAKTRKINMVEHDLKLRSIGMSERVKKLILRAILVLIPVMLIIYWLAKTR